MTILHICHSYYPPFLDCARQYAALFKDTPYKVLTVFLTGKADEAVAAGVGYGEVVFLGYKSKQVGGLKLGAIYKIKQLHQKYAFKFCIAHRVKPTYVALLATNLPVISVHHNYNDYSRASRRPLVNFYKKRILMLGVSDSVRNDLRRDLKSWPPEQVQTLYNRIDIEAVKAQLLNKTQARSALNLPQQAYVIGNVGRLHHDKDQKTLIAGFAKALPQLPVGSLLIIIGAGPLESDLKQQVSQLNLEKNIIFTGNLPIAKQYFKAFDIFALTSDNEPFGMVLLEAMAAQLPIICSDCGGGAEVVRGVGELFTFGDADQLALKIMNMSHNTQPPTFDTLMQQFSDEAAKTRFWQLYNSKNA